MLYHCLLYHCLIVYTFPTLRANKSTVWSSDKSINPVPQQAQLSNKSTFALLWFESLFPLLVLQHLALLFGHGWDLQTSWLPMTTPAICPNNSFDLSLFFLFWHSNNSPHLALQQLPLLFGHGWDPQTSWLPMTTRAPAFFQSLCSLFTRPSVMWYNQFVWSQAHLPSAYYLFKQLLWLGLWKRLWCDISLPISSIWKGCGVHFGLTLDKKQALGEVVLCTLPTLAPTDVIPAYIP